MSNALADLYRSRRRLLVAGGIAVAGIVAIAIRPPFGGDAVASPAADAAAPVVPVAKAVSTALDLGATQVARIEAAQRVELQARVSGPIEAVLFREGELVRAGQPLFRIDPRPFEANLARARADLELARARESLATAEADRARHLHVDRAIASEELERRVAAHAEARARRAAAEAAVRAAELEHDFTLIRAPIDGRIGRALVTAGNFVTAGTNATALTTLVSVSPLHVHFDVADRGVLEQVVAQRGVKGWTALVLDPDGQRELTRAPIDFSNHSIDASTGTLRLRARIDRVPPGLVPGQYVRIRLETGVTSAALLVPDQAVGTDQGQRYVLVVGDGGTVEYRPVRVGAAHGPHRIVTSGLEAGEQVIVSGLMRVRPGITVRTRPAAEPVHTTAAGQRAS